MKFRTKISKNGIMYYIRIPSYQKQIDYNTYVVVKIILSEDLIIPLLKRVVKLGKYKCITLPSKLNKIWSILHGKKVFIEIQPVFNVSEIEKSVNEVIQKILKT